MDIYDAYDELSVMRGPEKGSAGEVMRARLRELAQEIVSGPSGTERSGSAKLLGQAERKEIGFIRVATG